MMSTITTCPATRATKPIETAGRRSSALNAGASVPAGRVSSAEGSANA
jgi:hypothetical protein